MCIFSCRLRDAIKRKGVSQKEISIKLDITENSMSSYITGKVLPQIDILLKLCTILDVSADWLIGADSQTRGVPIPDDDGISQRISDRIKYLNMSQADVARSTGLSKNAISLYVMGKRTPTRDNLQSIASVLQVSVPWLLTGVDELDDSAVDGFAEVRLTDDELEVIRRMRCGQEPMFADDVSRLSGDVGRLNEAEVDVILKLRSLPGSECQDFYDFLDLKYKRQNPKSKVRRTSLYFQNENADPESSDSPTGIA